MCLHMCVPRCDGCVIGRVGSNVVWGCFATGCPRVLCRQY